MASNITIFILFIRRCGGLIFTPYATMRNISIDEEWKDLLWIGFLSVGYFFITNAVRFGGVGLLGACGLFIETIFIFSFLPAKGSTTEKAFRLIKTWAYTLIPTLIWFYTTLLFYFILPPPRTISLLGKSFSIFYIAFSGSLLVWKLILAYLSVRFSLRIHLYRVIYYLLIYLALSIPLWILLYHGGISRIPFV